MCYLSCSCTLPLFDGYLVPPCILCRAGDVVGTLAWNTTRHLEAWYGTMGLGAITHTLNPRLSSQDIAYIANNGEDKLMLCDYTLVPVVTRIGKDLPQLQGVIILTDRSVQQQTISITKQQYAYPHGCK